MEHGTEKYMKEMKVLSKFGADFEKANIAHLKIIQLEQRLKIFHYLMACKQDSVNQSNRNPVFQSILEFRKMSVSW